MQSPRNVVLVGPMGAGKSTIGRLLAELLGFVFRDTDTLIEQRTGAAIAWIFGGGGGKVISPLWVTVAPRITSSSMLWSMTPSFFGVRSVSMWRTLLA